MWIVEAIIIGLIVGFIARLAVPGKHPTGLIVTAIIGIAGSVIATAAGKAAGWYHSGQSASFLASIVGAIVLLLALQALSGRRTW
ncbi:MAG TPA: GlsB/YeaQ/YmgE family stress response membrane protein [Gaiellales bacterium]|jgi:uncharacterized membrane protein YeaQ/YmgE (transglycosylase-associated protein family)|nr:GlsB/YeaQ/YmgE family stress response membrane protein [Gaiellales bacterium]